MNGRERNGVAESIRRRLRNEFRARGEDVSQGLQRYAVERFLYRLGRSPHRERFVLKGATLFAIWGTAYRPTRDIDFTGFGSSNPEVVIEAFREICTTPDEVGQLVFDTEAITATPIRDGFEYDGLRIMLIAQLGNSSIPVRVDVGFGNAIVPGPEEREYRTILGDPPPRILTYPPESVVAEKLQAMVWLGKRNSRYKDFYDLYAMAGAFVFERSTLVQAVKATFGRRKTPVEAGLPAALTASFYANENRAVQWRAYLNRNELIETPFDFIQVGNRLIAFLHPIWADLGAGIAIAGNWTDGGPWR